jgi:ABC-type dipeptide/oligopeptide/nickel transport system permease subunit
MEVTLSYLRIGIQPPTVSWGTLIYSGRDLLYSSGYWLIAFPALATALTAAGYLLLGRSLERIARPGAFA